MSDLPKLPNYILQEKLGESLQTLVYKGVHKKQPDTPLVLKFLKLLSSWDDQSRHLRQKIKRLKVLHDERASTPLALEIAGDLQFIVQPWFSGIPLNDWANQQTDINLTDFFKIAITLADILQSVHEAGITHGGVKPHNILIQASTLTLRLIDFITPLDIRDVSHFIYDFEFVRNTLAYTSPEQTGRINYRVDFSTDLYSLGIVFYELLTGELPFFSNDPLELIHAHLAEEAIKIHELNPDIPEQLSHIIGKLMVKQPEKRYQSAAGLLVDLIRCRNEYQETGHIGLFSIGLRDRSKRVVFISKMVGRYAESKLIKSEYQAVMRGEFRSIFISGFSGIGKTRLIQELQKPLVKNRGYFTSGKFDQYQKNIPYSSLIQALRNLMRTFLTESDAQVIKWQEKILLAVGSDGAVITDVVPELKFIIGEQREVIHLPPVEARNRFNNLFCKFLSCLASNEHPLIVFIDDLQWCDTATFDFLQNIFLNPEDYPYLFFIGAYRHNEVDISHPLTKLMQVIKQQQVLNAILLGALNEEDSHEMVAYILDSSLAATVNIAQFIHHLTEGNPLFISESLAWLYNEDLLYTDKEQHWHWDMTKIRNTQMPATVVELFSSKVKKLFQDTLYILNHCACMGNRFTAEELALILQIDLSALFEQLKPVLSLGLLLENKTDLQFVHDRVQEAVLKQIDDTERLMIHWRIGQRLLSNLPANADLATQDNLFTIAAHLNKGCPKSLDEYTRYTLVTINFHAGNKALDALASFAANDFFRIAHDYLLADAWQSHYELTFRIYQHLAKTDLMCGHYEESELLLNQLIDHALSDFDKAEALAEQTTSLSSFGNFKLAIMTANRGLAYFNQAIPEQPDIANARMLQLMADISQQGDVWTKILNMPFTTERKSKIELAFYSELIPDLYMSGLVPQLYLSAAQSTQLCLSGGMDESVIYSFSIMGLLLGEQEQFELAFRYEDLARDLCAKYPNTFGATRGMNGIVWCNMHSRSHPADIVAYCLTAIQCGKNCGDLYNAGLSYGPMMWNLQVQGKNLKEIEDIAEECLQFSKKNQLYFSVGLAEAVLSAWVKPMKADYLPVNMSETLQRWAENNYVAASGSYFVLLAMSQYYRAEYQAASLSLMVVENYLHGLTDNVLKRLWYVFRILNALKTTPKSSWHDCEKEINALLLKIETWAKLGVLLKPYLALVYAEIARFQHHPRTARSLYLDAIASAKHQHYVFLTGHLYESFGDFLLETELDDANLYYAEAYRLYELCHAEAKLLLLQERYQQECLVNHAEVKVLLTTEQKTLPNLDVNYLMKSALALSAETDLELLLQKIMTVVLECSGAQHGYLLIKELDELVVAAEHHIGKQPVLKPQHYQLSQAQGICISMVNYVFRTQEKIVLTDASVECDFNQLPEARDLGLRSVLCLPVIKQGQLIGVLFLENRLSTGIFTAEKTGITELLTSHAAISLENARLLSETHQAYAQLQESREHMMQMEKLSALGTLVGGVAHEINNPLMGVMNYVEFAQTKTDDKQIAKVLGSALHEIGRIKSIVSNMLIYVRTKGNPSDVCHIAEALNQTLFLLEGEFKKNQYCHSLQCC